MTDHNVDTNGCSCQGSAVDSDCPQHGQYSEQGEIHRNSTVATCGAVRHYSFCMPGRPCDKNSRPTEFETVESVYQELHRQGYTLSRQAVKQIVKTIQENKLALDFLGRM